MSLRKGDLLIVVVLIVIGAFLIVYRQVVEPARPVGNVVAVEMDGELLQRVDLSKQQEKLRIASEHGYNVLEFSEGRVRVVEADCRDQICVNFGWISRVGQTVVCLPHRLVVRVINEDVNDLDGYAY